MKIQAKIAVIVLIVLIIVAATLAVLYTLSDPLRGVNTDLVGGIAQDDPDYDSKIAAYENMQAEVESFVSVVQTELRDASSGFELGEIPPIVVHNTPGLMFIDHGRNIVVGPYWEGLPEQFSALFELWAREANLALSAEEFFKANFNWYLVSHELGHFVDRQRGTLGEWDFFTAELVANKMAVVHFLKTGREAELLRFLEDSDKLAAYLQFPIPSGLDEVSYFNENYHELGAEPQLYGYYQFSQYRQAYEEVKQEGVGRIIDVR